MKTKDQRKSFANLVVLYLLLLLFNFCYARYLPNFQNSIADFPKYLIPIILYITPAVANLVLGLIGRFVLQKRAPLQISFFGNSKLKSALFFMLPLVCLTVIGVENNFQLNPHLYGVMLGLSLSIFVLSSEIFWRGYLTEILSDLKPQWRSLIVGSAWFFASIVIFYASSTDFYWEDPISNMILLYIISLFSAWFLDRILHYSKSILIGAAFIFVIQVSILNPAFGFLSFFESTWTLLIIGFIGFLMLGEINLKQHPKGDPAHKTPISKITIFKEIRRRGRNGVIEELTFETIYHPDFKDPFYRIFAKFLDALFYLTVVILFHKLIAQSDFNFLAYSGWTLVLLLIFNPLSEYFFGTTFGKALCGTRVIDDEGENPGLIKSYQRNFSLLILLIPGLKYYPGTKDLKIDMNSHNTFHQTYVIWECDYEEILDHIYREYRELETIKKEMEEAGNFIGEEYSE